MSHMTDEASTTKPTAVTSRDTALIANAFFELTNYYYS
jgi:hypothetical protein